jgi:hypothetical protein
MPKELLQIPNFLFNLKKSFVGAFCFRRGPCVQVSLDPIFPMHFVGEVPTWIPRLLWSNTSSWFIRINSFEELLALSFGGNASQLNLIDLLELETLMDTNFNYE